jgi:hypothetical protein
MFETFFIFPADTGIFTPVYFAAVLILITAVILISITYVIYASTIIFKIIKKFSKNAVFGIKKREKCSILNENLTEQSFKNTGRKYENALAFL